MKLIRGREKDIENFGGEMTHKMTTYRTVSDRGYKKVNSFIMYKDFHTIK